jgi:hypothetical protein
MLLGVRSRLRKLRPARAPVFENASRFLVAVLRIIRVRSTPRAPAKSFVDGLSLKM